MRGTFKFVTLAMLVLVVVGLYSCGGNKATNEVTQPADSSRGSGSIYSAVVYIYGYKIGPGSFATRFTAVLFDSLYQPITNAEVAIRHDTLGTITLAHDTLSPGRYSGFIVGYLAGRYSFAAKRGSDSISGAHIDALDIHGITFPAPSDTLKMGDSFQVRWSRSVQADTAKVGTLDFDPALTSDNGNFMVPNSPKARTDQQITVWRFHDVPQAGGYPNLYLHAVVSNSVEPVVVQ